MHEPLDIYGMHDEGPAAMSPPARPSLPSHAQLVYAKELMTVVLLALAFPWVVTKLLTNPAQVLSGAGRKQIGKAAS